MNQLKGSRSFSPHCFALPGWTLQAAVSAQTLLLLMPRPRQTSLFLRAVSRRSLCHRFPVRREPIPLSIELLPRIKPQFRTFTSTRMAAAAPRRDLPAWSPPTATSERPLPPLTIYNTFTRKKEPFVPLDKSGKKVTWYCCGPTVYDSAHLGHARNYVTTDVVRRIMRDYFGFDVHFVQNVTDVDDKVRLCSGVFSAESKTDWH